jgi:hypothetical protein
MSTPEKIYKIFSRTSNSFWWDVFHSLPAARGVVTRHVNHYGYKPGDLRIIEFELKDGVEKPHKKGGTI